MPSVSPGCGSDPESSNFWQSKNLGSMLTGDYIAVICLRDSYPTRATHWRSRRKSASKTLQTKDAEPISSHRTSGRGRSAMVFGSREDKGVEFADFLLPALGNLIFRRSIKRRSLHREKRHGSGGTKTFVQQFSPRSLRRARRLRNRN